MPIYHVETKTYEFTKNDKNNKSNQFAPQGYAWIGNTIKFDENLINNYRTEGCILLESAYDISGNFLDDHYALYKKL